MLTRLSINQAKLVRSLRQKKYRDQESLFWLEGQRLCHEVLLCKADVSFVIVDKDTGPERYTDMINDFQSRGIDVYQADFDRISDTKSPQGIGCVLPFLNHPPDINNSKRLLLADGIQDPGNLGTIMRTAEWFGFDGLVTGPQSADIYNPKLVRSSMGALLNLPVLEHADLVDYASNLKKTGFTIVGSELKLPAKPLTDMPKKLALIIGSEATGIQQELYSTIDYNFIIPGQGKSESLNAAVAAGIIMHSLTSGT